MGISAAKSGPMSHPADPGETWRVPPSWRTPEWCRDAGILWESWAANGEVCITGLTPPAPGLARLAHRLTWTLRSFASRCRRTFDGTGALEFSPGFPAVRVILVA
jgi:hypothetical protein